MGGAYKPVKGNNGLAGQYAKTREFKKLSRRQVLDLYRNCYGSCARMGEAYGISGQTVRRLLRQHWLLSKADMQLTDSDVAMAAETDDDPLEDEVRTHKLVSGSAFVIGEVIGDWSRRMGMEPEGKAVTFFDVALIREEYIELTKAVESEDRVEQLDALADLVYTIFNVAWRRGMPLSLALGEVHRSNDTKEPNGQGKPTKGSDFEAPDLKSILADSDAALSSQEDDDDEDHQA